MINVNVKNTYSPLKEVILGGIDGSIMSAIEDMDDFARLAEIVSDTIQDLGVIEDVMSQLGIIVHRPAIKLNCAKPITTPDWTEMGSRIPLSPRDIFLVIDDTIVEMTPMSRFRYFEHWAYKDIMTQCFKHGAHWISMPKPALYDSPDLEPLLEGASVLQHDGHLFVSTTVTSNALGIDWLQRQFHNHTMHYMDEIFDAHLDAHFNIIRPGLVATHIDKHFFPDYFKNWEFIYLDTDMDREISQNQAFMHDYVQDDDHANTALTINFLSIDENRILLYDHHKHSKTLLSQFKKHNVEPIFVPFRHCHFFNQGITCVTLELERE